MKKAFKISALFLFLSLALVSCSKDDESASTTGSLVGKWEFFKEGGVVNGNEILVAYEHQTGCAKDNLEFFENNTYVETYYFEDCEVETSDGTYTKSGNTLTTNDGFDTYSITIKQLSGSTLKLQVTYNEDGETYTESSLFKKVN